MRDPHRRRRLLSPARLAICGGAILLGFTVGILCLNYGPKAYSGWREAQLLKRASAMLEKQNFAEATRAAQQALQIRPDSLAAFNVLADATEKQNRVETVAWRAQIARLLPRHLDSQLNLASAALRFGQLDTARRALDHVAEPDREKAAYHVVAGWLARAHGNDAEVERHFAAAVKKEPANDLYQFNLAVLQIRSPEPEKSSESRAILERLSKVATFRAGSLRALLSDAVQRNDLERADGLAKDLQMTQQVTFADYLLCLDFYRKLDEKKLGPLLEKVKPVATREASDLAMLMAWMNKNNLGAEVLKWMDKLPSELTTQPPASIEIAQAFAEAKNWSRLKRWTRSGSWEESEFLRIAYQAYATRQARQAGGDAEFDSLWRSAERAVNAHPERALQLARLATEWGLTIEAEQLWLQVAKNAASRREALDALFRIYRANNDLNNLYRTAQRLHESSPQEIGAATTYARLALLFAQHPAEGHRVAKAAYDQAPADVNCAITYAFSLYGLGRTAEGIEVLKKLPADAWHDPHAAVYAAVLLLDDNQSEAAKVYSDTAQQGPLFPEEKRLLEEALTKTSSAPTPATPPAAEEITPPPAELSPPGGSF